MKYLGATLLFGALTMACSRPPTQVATLEPCPAMTEESAVVADLRKLMADTTRVAALQRLAADTATTVELRRLLANTATTAEAERLLADTAGQAQLRPLVDELHAEVLRMRRCGGP